MSFEFETTSAVMCKVHVAAMGK